MVGFKQTYSGHTFADRKLAQDSYFTVSLDPAGRLTAAQPTTCAGVHLRRIDLPARESSGGASSGVRRSFAAF